MITGATTSKLLLWMLLCSNACFAGVVAIRPAVAQETQFTLNHLSVLLSTQSSRYANFEELHFSSLLSEPLRVQGTLIFVAPTRLEKHITAPHEEMYIAEGNTVVYENKAKRIRRTVGLEDYPFLEAIVQTLRATFAGDFATLAKLYRLNLKGNQDQWQLTLDPHQRPLQSVIASVSIQGHENKIARLEIHERSGDYSQMRIVEVR